LFKNAQQHHRDVAVFFTFSEKRTFSVRRWNGGTCAGPRVFCAFAPAGSDELYRKTRFFATLLNTFFFQRFELALFVFRGKIKRFYDRK
jgi:hypothetical protein